MLASVHSDINSEFEQKAVSFVQLKRTACAAEYYEACTQFLSDANLETLSILDTALTKVDSEDVDLSEAERLVDKARDFFDVDGPDELHIQKSKLAAVQLVLRFQVSKPGSRWLGAHGITEKAAATFRDLVMGKHTPETVNLTRKDKSGVDNPSYDKDLALSGLTEAGSELGLVDPIMSIDLSEFADTLITIIELWCTLLKKNNLEEHQIHPLLACAMHWLFDSKYSSSTTQISLKFSDLFISGYVVLPVASQEQALHQIITQWLKAPNSTKIMADLVLQLLARIGTVPLSIWSSAVTFHNRELLEREALKKHTETVSCANVICRRLIDTLWQSSRNSIAKVELASLLEECSKRLTSFHWPAAELFMSAFISSLFKLSKVIHSQKYLSFMLEILKPLHDTLYEVKASTSTSVLDVKTTAANKSISASREVLIALNLCLNREQAFYLASRQMVMPNQPYYDYHNALIRPNTAISEPERNEWLAVLGQWSIVNYHSHIVAVMLELAKRDDLRENLQVELFKILHSVILADPSLFNESWLDRLNWITPVVCETMVPIVQHMYNLQKNPILIEKLCDRVASPGASQYKKKILSMLVSYDQEVCLKLTWQTFLIAACDSDYSVGQMAIDSCNHWLQCHEVSDELAQVLIESKTSEGSLLVQRGLKIWLNSIVSSRVRFKVQYMKIQSLVEYLLVESKLNFASVFIEVDGRFTPGSWIKVLFDKVMNQTMSHQYNVQALKIISCALCARPRLIVAPLLAANMFAGLIKRIKVCSEPEMESIASILGQLLSLGGEEVQEQRSDVLRKIFNSTFTLLRKEKRLAVCRQAILICGGARFWPVDEELINQFTCWLIDWAPYQTIEMRLLALRTVFVISSHHEILFSDSKIENYFTSVPSNSAEANCLTRELLKLLWSPQFSSTHHAVELPKDAKSRVSAVDIASSVLIQKQFNRLTQVASTEENLGVLRVLVKAMDDNLIVAEECIPLITSLSFSLKPAVAQTALSAFVLLCKKGSKHLGPKFVEGLRNIRNAEVRPRPLVLMWKAMEENLRASELKTILSELCVLLDWSTDMKLLKLLIDGIMISNFDAKDVKVFIHHIENMTNLYDARHHDSGATAKVCLLFIFALWLRRRFGITETKFAAKEENLELMDREFVWTTINQRENLVEFIDELRKLPDYYGSISMNKLVFG